MIKKIITSTLSILLFVGQTVFANSLETNFWKERQSKIKAQSNPIELAYALPSLSQQLSSFPKQFALLPISENFSIQSGIYESLINAIPSNLGSVREVIHPYNKGASKKVVILVQDIHMNQEAQKNISLTMSRLQAQNPLDFIALEGLGTEFKSDFYRKISNPPVLKSVADYLLEENKISGPIHAALIMPQMPPYVFGVDNPGLHKKNVEAYLNANGYSKDYKELLKNQEQQLMKEALQLLNPSLRSFDGFVHEFKRNEIDLGQYVERLSKYSPLTSELDKFHKGILLEKSLDFKKVEVERAHLLSALVNKLNEKEKTNLIKMGMAYRNAAVNAIQFHQYLSNLSEGKRVYLKDYPEFGRFIEYVKITDRVSGDKIFLDLQNQEKKVYATLIQTQEESTHVDKLNLNRFSQKLIDFSLTRHEWDVYRDLRKKYSNPLLTKIALFEEFYVYAQRRDSSMAAALIDKFKRKDRAMGVLVVGGFHSNGITSRLREAGFTILVFVPKITKLSIDNQESYLGVFSQEKTPLEKLVMGEKLFLSRDPSYGKRLIRPLSNAVQLGMSNLITKVTIRIGSREGEVNYMTELSLPSTSGKSGVVPKIIRVTSNVRPNYFRFVKTKLNTFFLGMVFILSALSPSLSPTGNLQGQLSSVNSAHISVLSELQSPVSEISNHQEKVESVEKEIDVLKEKLKEIKLNPFGLVKVQAASTIEESGNKFTKGLVGLAEKEKNLALAVLEHPVTGKFDFYLKSNHLQHIGINTDGETYCRMRPAAGEDHINYIVHMKKGIVAGLKNPDNPSKYAYSLKVNQISKITFNDEGKLKYLALGNENLTVEYDAVMVVSVPSQLEKFNELKKEISGLESELKKIEESAPSSPWDDISESNDAPPLPILGQKSAPQESVIQASPSDSPLSFSDYWPSNNMVVGSIIAFMVGFTGFLLKYMGKNKKGPVESHGPIVPTGLMLNENESEGIQAERIIESPPTPDLTNSSPSPPATTNIKKTGNWMWPLLLGILLGVSGTVGGPFIRDGHFSQSIFTYAVTPNVSNQVVAQVKHQEIEQQSQQEMKEQELRRNEADSLQKLKLEKLKVQNENAEKLVKLNKDLEDANSLQLALKGQLPYFRNLNVLTQSMNELTQAKKMLLTEVEKTESSLKKLREEHVYFPADTSPLLLGADYWKVRDLVRKKSTPSKPVFGLVKIVSQDHKSINHFIEDILITRENSMNLYRHKDVTKELKKQFPKIKDNPDETLYYIDLEEKQMGLVWIGSSYLDHDKEIRILKTKVDALTEQVKNGEESFVAAQENYREIRTLIDQEFSNIDDVNSEISKTEINILGIMGEIAKINSDSAVIDTEMPIEIELESIAPQTERLETLGQEPPLKSKNLEHVELEIPAQDENPSVFPNSLSLRLWQAGIMGGILGSLLLISKLTSMSKRHIQKGGVLLERKKPERSTRLLRHTLVAMLISGGATYLGILMSNWDKITTLFFPLPLKSEFVSFPIYPYYFPSAIAGIAALSATSAFIQLAYLKSKSIKTYVVSIFFMGLVGFGLSSEAKAFALQDIIQSVVSTLSNNEGFYLIAFPIGVSASLLGLKLINPKISIRRVGAKLLLFGILLLPVAWVLYSGTFNLTAIIGVPVFIFVLIRTLKGIAVKLNEEDSQATLQSSNSTAEQLPKVGQPSYERPFFDIALMNDPIEGVGNILIAQEKIKGQEAPWFGFGPLPPKPSSAEMSSDSVDSGKIDSSEPTTEYTAIENVGSGQGILEIRKEVQVLMDTKKFSSIEIDLTGLINKLLNGSNSKINAMIINLLINPDLVLEERIKELWKIDKETYARALSSLMTKRDLYKGVDDASNYSGELKKWLDRYQNDFDSGKYDPLQLRKLNKLILQSIYSKGVRKPKVDKTVTGGAYGRDEEKYAQKLGNTTHTGVLVDKESIVRDILEAGWIPDDNNLFFFNGSQISFKEAERIGFTRVEIRPYENLSLMFANQDIDDPEYMKHAYDRDKQVPLRSKTRMRIHTDMLVEVLTKWRNVYSRFKSGEATTEELNAATQRFWNEDFFARAEVKRRDASTFFKVVGRFLLKYADRIANGEYQFAFVPPAYRDNLNDQTSLSKHVHYATMLGEQIHSLGRYDRIAFSKDGMRCNLDFNMSTYDYDDPHMKFIDEKTGMIKIPFKSAMKRTYGKDVFIFELKWAPKVHSRIGWSISDYLKDLKTLRNEGHPKKEIYDVIGKYELFQTGMAKSPDAIDKPNRPDKDYIFGIDEYDPEAEYFNLPPSDVELGLKYKSEPRDKREWERDEADIADMSFDDGTVNSAVDPLTFVFILHAIGSFSGFEVGNGVFAWVSGMAMIGVMFLLIKHLRHMIKRLNKLNRTSAQPAVVGGSPRGFFTSKSFHNLIFVATFLSFALGFPNSVFAEYGFSNGYYGNWQHFWQLYNSLVIAALGASVISYVYQKTQPAGRSYDYKMTWTLALFPLSVAFIMWLFSGSSFGFALNISLLGILGIINFRTIMKSAFESMYVLAAIGFGLASSLGEWSGAFLYLGFFATIVGLLASLATGIQRDPHLKIQFEWYGNERELEYFEVFYLSKLTERDASFSSYVSSWYSTLFSWLPQRYQRIEFYWGQNGVNRLQAKPADRTLDDGTHVKVLEVDYRVRILNPTEEGIKAFNDAVKKFELKKDTPLIGHYIFRPVEMEYGFILVLIESCLNVIRFLMSVPPKPIGLFRKTFDNFNQLVQHISIHYSVEREEHNHAQSQLGKLGFVHKEPLAKTLNRWVTDSLMLIFLGSLALSLMFTIPLAGYSATAGTYNSSAVYSTAISKNFSAPAVVTAPDVDLSFKNEGAIVAVLVGDNENVKANQALAVLQIKDRTVDQVRNLKKLAITKYNARMGQIDREIAALKTKEAFDVANAMQVETNIIQLEKSLLDTETVFSEKLAQIDELNKQLVEALEFTYPKMQFSGYSTQTGYSRGISEGSSTNESVSHQSGTSQSDSYGSSSGNSSGLQIGGNSSNGSSDSSSVRSDNIGTQSRSNNSSGGVSGSFSMGSNNSVNRNHQDGSSQSVTKTRGSGTNESRSQTWSSSLQLNYQKWGLQGDLLRVFESMSTRKLQLAMTKAGLSEVSIEKYRKLMLELANLEEIISATWAKIQPQDFSREIKAANDELLANLRLIEETNPVFEILQSPVEGRVSLHNDIDVGATFGSRNTRALRVYSLNKRDVTIPLQEAINLPVLGSAVQFIHKLTGEVIGYGRISFVPDGKTPAPPETWDVLRSGSLASLFTAQTQPPQTYNLRVEVLPEYRLDFRPGELYYARINPDFIIDAPDSGPVTPDIDSVMKSFGINPSSTILPEALVEETKPFAPSEFDPKALASAFRYEKSIADDRLGVLSGLTFNSNTGTYFSIDGKRNVVVEFDRNGAVKRKVNIQGLLPFGKENFGPSKIKRLKDGRFGILNIGTEKFPTELIVVALDKPSPQRLVDPVEVFRFPNEITGIRSFSFTSGISILFFVDLDNVIYKAKMNLAKDSGINPILVEEKYFPSRDGVSSIFDFDFLNLGPKGTSFLLLAKGKKLHRYSFGASGVIENEGAYELESQGKANAFTIDSSGISILSSENNTNQFLHLSPNSPDANRKPPPQQSQSLSANNWGEKFSGYVGGTSSMELGNQSNPTTPIGILNGIEFSLVKAGRLGFTKDKKPGNKKRLNELSGLAYIDELKLFSTIDDEGYLVFFDKDTGQMFGKPLDLNVFADSDMRKKGLRVDPEAVTYMGANLLAIAFEASKNVPNHRSRIVIFDISDIKNWMTKGLITIGNSKVFLMPENLSHLEGFTFNLKTGAIILADQKMKHVHLGHYKGGKLSINPTGFDLSSLKSELGDVAFWNNGAVILTKGNAPDFSHPRLHYLHTEGPKKGMVDSGSIDLSHFKLPKAEGLAVYREGNEQHIGIVGEKSEENDIVILKESGPVQKVPSSAPVLRTGMIAMILSVLIADASTSLGNSMTGPIVSAISLWFGFGIVLAMARQFISQVQIMLLRNTLLKLKSNEIVFVVVTEADYDRDIKTLRNFQWALRAESLSTLRKSVVVVYSGNNSTQDQEIQKLSGEALFVHNQLVNEQTMEFDSILILAQQLSVRVNNDMGRLLLDESTQFVSVLSNQERMRITSETLQKRHRFLSIDFRGMWPAIQSGLLEMLGRNYSLSSVSA